MEKPVCAGQGSGAALIAAPAVRNGMVAAAYLMFGWAGLLLAVPPGHPAGIGLPAGISLAAILRWGPGVWPGVWIGAFLLNAFHPGIDGRALPELAELAIAAAIALGSTLQPLAVGRLLVRSEPLPLEFATLGSVLRFALIWSPAGCLIAATAGVGTLWIAGTLGVAAVPMTWLGWWFGDWMGVLIGAPAVLALLDSLASGRPVAMAAVARANLLATAFDQGGEAIFVADADLGIIEVNPAFCALTGIKREQAIGRDAYDLFSGRTSGEQFRSIVATARERGHWQGEVWGRSGSGGDSPQWLVLAAVRNDRGMLVNHVGSFVDISERKHAEAKIEFLAHHDALTGLPNRFALQGRLEQALAQASRNQGRVAVMFIDMDRFKDINDSLGHDVGDLLLLEIARRLRECVRTSDVVARLGGDEFVVVLTGVADVEAAASTAAKLRQELASPYPIRGRLLHSSPSIGISMYPEHGETADVLTRNADAAMYRAKDSGRNNYQFFDVSLSERARERLELAADLRVALEQGSFLLHFQPQVRASDGRIVAAEALIRWPHPTRGMVPPDRFIGIAEEFGLIEAIGEWALAEACRELAALNALGIRGFRVCVNLSPKQLRDRELPGKVAAAIAASGILAADLELELTESVAMQDPQSTILLLNELFASGVGLAIDDFGTGYSSLSYLKMLPLHNLKLDRTFVRDIEVDASDRAICSATVALAHALGIKVVAEGVETETQRDFLLALGCDYLQGWLFSKAVAADQLAGLIQAAEDRA